jgi:serine/threonine protein phosphatase PrpC
MEYNFQIDSAAVSDRGLSEKRPQNEDSFLKLDERGVFAVADGVGGAQAGDVASQMAVEIIGEAFINSKPNSDAEEVMKAAIGQANASIFQMSHDLAQLSTMATTVVALHVAGNIATIGHVGDSRLYRLDGSGNLYRETQDHSVVEEEVRAGRMTPAQAANHPSRNVISRALGAEATVEIDMKTIMFEPNTMFLLCSDGITRHLNDFEIRDLLNSNQNPSAITAKMKEVCYERGAEDNLTAVIIKIGDAASPKSADNRETSDFEESTVASTRPLYTEPAAVSAQPAVEETEIPTQNLSLADIEEQPDETETFDSTMVESKPIVPKFEPTAVETQNNQPEPAAREAIVVETTEKREGGFFSKLLTSLLLLIVGGVLGAGGYYFWMQNNKPVEAPVIKIPTEVSQTDTLVSLFEKSRRAVDDNPTGYIAAHQNDTKNAEVFYLLGRANLLTGNFPEAKKSFDEAKNHLAETGAVNSKVLSNDIETGLIIANNPYAQEDFKKKLAQKKTDEAAPTNANVNSNANVKMNF